jgi:hypothetical protein
MDDDLDDDDDDGLDDDDEDDEGGMVCPVCNACWDEDEQCGHLASTWDYSEDTGMWEGDAALPPDFRDSIVEIGTELYENFENPEERRALIELLVPKSLAEIVDQSAEEGGRLDSELGNDFLGELVSRGPTFAGTTFDESSSPAGSVWISYWASDPAQCIRFADEALKRYIAAIRSANTVLKRVHKQHDLVKDLQ